jgi:hypothetical protein
MGSRRMTELELSEADPTVCFGKMIAFRAADASRIARGFEGPGAHSPVPLVRKRTAVGPVQSPAYPDRS